MNHIAFCTLALGLGLTDLPWPRKSTTAPPKSMAYRSPGSTSKAEPARIAATLPAFEAAQPVSGWPRYERQPPRQS